MKKAYQVQVQVAEVQIRQGGLQGRAHICRAMIRIPAKHTLIKPLALQYYLTSSEHEKNVCIMPFWQAVEVLQHQSDRTAWTPTLTMNIPGLAGGTTRESESLHNNTHIRTTAQGFTGPPNIRHRMPHQKGRLRTHHSLDVMKTSSRRALPCLKAACRPLPITGWLP